MTEAEAFWTSLIKLKLFKKIIAILVDGSNKLFSIVTFHDSAQNESDNLVFVMHWVKFTLWGSVLKSIVEAYPSGSKYGTKTHFYPSGREANRNKNSLFIIYAS